MTARKSLVGAFTLVSAIFLGFSARGATPPPAPAAPPASAPTPRKELTVPQGFKVITVNGRRAIVEPTDEPWVTQTLTKVAASAQPSTAPTNMLQKLRDQRETLIRQMMADL